MLSDQFMESGAAPIGVRPEIAASWHRSRGSQVSPSLALDSLPHHDVDLRGPVAAAAGPVLERLTDVLAGTHTSVILTDARAHILQRWVDDRALHRSLDRISAHPGADYGEAVIGTNGLGTVIATGRAVQVTGAEHFQAGLAGFTCAGAPLHHPVTNQLEGVVDLSCRFEDTNPLILPMVLEAVRAIQQRMKEASSETEQALLAHFIEARKCSSGPVMSLNASTVITNAAADQVLHADDYRLLWDGVHSGLASGRDVSGDMELTDGRRARFRSRPVEVGARVVGAVIELDLGAAVPASTRASPPLALHLAGNSALHRRLVAEVVRHGRASLPLLITGEAGSGRCAAARAVHDAGERGAYDVVDAASSLIDGNTAWFTAVRGLLRRSGTLVIRNLQILDAGGASALATLLDDGPGDGRARVLGTLTVRPEGTLTHLRPLLDRFPLRLEVPSLRARPEDIGPLVAAMLSRHGMAGSTRCRPEVVDVLARYDWPGNVRELESVVRGLVARRPTGDIVVADLPLELQRGAGPALTGLQQMEHDAIRAALDVTNGNRVEAASLLGISRSTLYRKLHAYGVDFGPR